VADLILLKFDSTYGAQQALSAVQALTELRKAWIDDVAVVEKHKSGRTATHTPHGSTTAGALWGGLLGMLLFWWFPPGWFFGAWVGGLAIGGAVGNAMKKSGLDESMIKEIKDELTNGSSMLLLMGAKGDADEMAEAFKPYNPTKVIRHEIPDTTVENLKEQFAENPPPPAEG